MRGNRFQLFDFLQNNRRRKRPSEKNLAKLQSPHVACKILTLQTQRHFNDIVGTPQLFDVLQSNRLRKDI